MQGTLTDPVIPPLLPQIPYQTGKTTILCPLCGLRFIPEQANICPACMLTNQSEQDFLKLNSDQVQICRFCLRYERPPWINCDRQSADLLGLLLRKIKNINRYKLIGAKFIWTEPHSKRIRVKVELQREINDNLKTVSAEVIQFKEIFTQCPDCKKKFTPHDWETIIQIRQHIEDKSSIQDLQRKLLKETFIHETLYKIDAVQDGIDLYFKNQVDSHRYIEFIKSNACMVLKRSKQMISHNQRDNTTNVKSTISIHMPKVCKHDLVRLHPVSAKQMGCSPMILCVKLTSIMHFMDVTTFRVFTMPIERYFHYEAYMTIYRPTHFGRKFMVVDNQGEIKNKKKQSGKGGKSVKKQNEEIRDEQCESEQNKIVKKEKKENNSPSVYGLIITPEGQLQEIYVKSQITAAVGDELLAYDFTANDDWACKNAPDYLIIKKIRTKVPKGKKAKAKQTKEDESEDSSEEQIKKKVVAVEGKEGVKENEVIKAETPE